eukprot:Hpha_TRINITY_DN33484_c0_g1::TRINITY_DN33484_c0_g1_i1::g.845::m.845
MQSEALYELLQSGCSHTLQRGVLSILQAPDAQESVVTAATVLLGFAHLHVQEQTALLERLGSSLPPPAPVKESVLDSVDAQSQQELQPATAAAPGTSASGETLYQGSLARRHDKGFGFIECKEANEMYGRDVLIQRTECEMLRVGDQVFFYMDVSPDGKLTARNVLRPVEQKVQQGAPVLPIMGGGFVPPFPPSPRPGAPIPLPSPLGGPPLKRPRTDPIAGGAPPLPAYTGPQTGPQEGTVYAGKLA